MIKTIIETYFRTKEEKTDWRYGELEVTPLLKDSEYLSDLYETAKDKEQKGAIFDHIYRHDALDVGRYEKLAKKYEKEFWEG
jgi:hypothetical protein